MPWVKIDDHFDEHPKLARVGPLGWGVWLAGLAYCNRNLTDGFIPWNKARMLVSFDVVEDDGRMWSLSRSSGMVGDDVTSDWVIGLLIDAGLWEAVENGRGRIEGYRIHDYEDFQPSKEQVEAERRANAERQSRFRKRTRNAVTNDVTNVPVTEKKRTRNEPPVPVPVPDPKDTVGDTPTPPARARAKPPAYSPEFEQFWTAYPTGHGNKKQAFTQWQRLAPDAETRAAMLDGVTKWEQSDRWQRGFIRDAERWIRDRSWEDTPPPSIAPVPSTPQANGRASPFEKTRAAFAEVDAALDDWIAQQSGNPDAIETTGRRHA